MCLETIIWQFRLFFRSICLGCFGRLDWEWWRQQSDLSKIFDPLRKFRCHYIEFVGDLTLTRVVATVYCVRQDLRLMAISTNFEKKIVKWIHERFLVILDLEKYRNYYNNLNTWSHYRLRGNLNGNLKVFINTLSWKSRSPTCVFLREMFIQFLPRFNELLCHLWDVNSEIHCTIVIK